MEGKGIAGMAVIGRFGGLTPAAPAYIRMSAASPA